jgi:hypothetical protein
VEGAGGAGEVEGAEGEEGGEGGEGDGQWVERGGEELSGVASLELSTMMTVHWVSAGCIIGSPRTIDGKARPRGGPAALM